MIRTAAALLSLLLSIQGTSGEEAPAYPSISYEIARSHELPPHRRTVPTQGVRPGFHQLRLTLVISPTGDVTKAEANGEDEVLKLWPSLQGEVLQWRFTPFEKNGHPITAQVEEYLDLVPPERLPKTHVTPPALRPDSAITLTLERSGCFGSCPAYTVTVSPTGIVFDGRSSVVAEGKHTASVDPSDVRKLAKRFEDADFFSMDDSYAASVTDNPTYILTLTVDGHTKSVMDYVGSWVGMPAILTDLEKEVDTLARTGRWIKGTDGLVSALKAEHLNVQTFAAQTMLKNAASEGETTTVEQFLAAGVPRTPLPRPNPSNPTPATRFTR